MLFIYHIFLDKNELSHSIKSKLSLDDMGKDSIL